MKEIYKKWIKPFAMAGSVFAGVALAEGFVIGIAKFLAWPIPILKPTLAALLVGAGGLYLAEWVWHKYVM